MPSAPVPGVAVEHARAGDPRREDVEQRLAQLVGRRPQPVPRRATSGGGPSASRRSRACNRVIGNRRNRWSTDRSITRLPDYQLPDFDQLEPRLPRSASRRSSACGVGGARLEPARRLALRDARAARDRARDRSAGTSAPRPAACRRNRPGRAARRSRSAISKPSVVSVIAFSRSRASSDSGD